jgi:uncharacterized protein YciI
MGTPLDRDYWLIRSVPRLGATAEDFAARMEEHLSWVLAREQEGTVFLSGPLIEGPGVAPGSGITVLRAQDATEAAKIAAEDPFVVAGLRDPEVFRWRVKEGAIQVGLTFGTGTFTWG